MSLDRRGLIASAAGALATLSGCSWLTGDNNQSDPNTPSDENNSTDTASEPSQPSQPSPPDSEFRFEYSHADGQLTLTKTSPDQVRVENFAFKEGDSFIRPAESFYGDSESATWGNNEFMIFNVAPNKQFQILWTGGDSPVVMEEWSPPVPNTDFRFEYRYVPNELKVFHAGGDPIDMRYLTIIGDVGNTGIDSSRSVVDEDGDWTTGRYVYLENVANGETVKIVWEGDENAGVIAEYTARDENGIETR